MTIKLKSLIEQVQEINIEFPIYYKLIGYYKLLSPSSLIQAKSEDGEFLILKYKDVPNFVENVILNGAAISADEFKEAYQKAMNHIVHEAFMQDATNNMEIVDHVYARNEDLQEKINSYK